MAFQESPPPSRGRAGWGVFPPRATMPGHSLAESDIAARFAAAQALAREAGALAVALRGGPAASFAVESKSALDFATEADRAVERLVIERLGKRFGDGVLGEEYGAQQEAVDRLWVVDPVDGTFNFMHGLPVWCVSLAFMLAGEIEIGIIYNPDGNEMFTARRGRGAFLDGAPIKVSAGRHAAPLVEVGHSNRVALARYLGLVGGVFGAGCEFRRLGSGALGLASVAAGRTDGYLELHINSWDVLAGMLLVREAGGWTNDFLAGDGLRGGNPIVACTPELRGTLAGLLAGEGGTDD
jgi:myo-inositol-1(or 4)-monophosphatase